MTTFIHDTWSEDWADLSDRDLLDPEPIAQLWRCINTKRATMQKTVHVPYTYGLFRPILNFYPDGTDPDDVVTKRSRETGVNNYAQILAFARSSLIIPIVISGKSYVWATGTESSYTIVGMDDVPPYGRPESDTLTSAANVLRTFFDKLDLLVEIITTAHVTFSSTLKTWSKPGAFMAADVEAVFIDTFKYQRDVGLPTQLAFSSAVAGYPYPHRYVGLSTSPITIGDILAYEYSPQSSIYPIPDAGFRESLLFNGSEMFVSASGERDTGTGNYKQIPPAFTVAIDASAARIGTRPDNRGRNYGNYERDGGLLLDTDTDGGTVDTIVYKYGSQYKFPVAGYTPDIDAQNNKTFSNSYSGYVVGNKTSYTLQSGCPASVSVVLGTYDPISNVTPITITTGSWDGPGWLASVDESFPARSETLTLDRYNTRAIIAGTRRDGTSVNTLVLDTDVLDDTVTVTDDAYNTYSWSKGTQTWSVLI